MTEGLEDRDGPREGSSVILDGLSVGLDDGSFTGLLVGLAVGTGSGIPSKRSFGSKRYDSSKFLRLGQTWFMAEFGISSHDAILLKTASLCFEVEN